MRITFYILFILIFSLLSATAQQNLVPNPSFEDTIACPIGIGNIYNATGWSSFRETPDYENICNNSQAGVPSNLFGYQNAENGNAYAGFYGFARFASNAREIIGIQLIQSLSIGQKYFVSFYVSRAFNPDPGLRINIAINKLGVRFSTIGYSYINPIPIDNISQIYYDSIITDTLNWFKISGSFIADSTYRFVSIGNFFTDSATTPIILDSSAALAYYYIDDIKVSTDSVFVNETQENNSDNLIKIFPNPAGNWIIIEGSNIKSFSIFDAFGKKCIEDVSDNTSYCKINLNNLSGGVYFIRIKNNKKYIIQKIILTNINKN